MKLRRLGTAAGGAWSASPLSDLDPVAGIGSSSGDGTVGRRERPRAVGSQQGVPSS